MKRTLIAACLVSAFAVAPAVADTKADALFKKGKKLLAEKSYAAACDAFEESDKLDPGIGAKLNVAKCFEEWGRLTKAMRWYQDALAMAKTEKDERKAKIAELITALDSEIPRLIVKVPAKANLESSAVKLDGAALEDFDEPILVDPGPHEVQYQFNNETRTKTVQLERGGERELTLDLELIPEANDEKKQRARKPPPEPPTPGRGRRILGVSLAGIGVAGLGVAGYLTLDARSTYKDAIATHCGGSTTACNADGLRITKDARSQANMATVVSLVSAAVVAGGLVLYLTAPDGSSSDERRDDDEAMYLTPMIGTGVGGIVFGGGF